MAPASFGYKVSGFMYKPYALLLRTVLSSLLLSAPSVVGQQCQPSDKILLTGPEQGYYYKLGRAIAEVASDEGLHICAKTTTRNLNNILKLEAGDQGDFAIAQSDVAHDVWHGYPRAVAERAANVRIVMPLYLEAVHILLRPHLNISRVEDLKGRKVGLFLAGSGTEYTAKRVLEAAGLQPEGRWKNVQAISTSRAKFCDSVQQLLSKDLDALFRVTVVRSVDIQDALKDPGQDVSDCAGSSEIKLLPLDFELVERLVRDGSYSELLILKNDYENQDQSTLTVGVQALLLAGKNAQGSGVKTLARILRSRPRDVENALAEIVNEEHSGHDHPTGNLPKLSLLNIPVSATL